jgi:hypothetical protein
MNNTTPSSLASSPGIPTKMAGLPISAADAEQFSKAAMMPMIITAVLGIAVLFFVYMLSQQLSNSLCSGSL